MVDWRKLSRAEQLKFYKQCKELYSTGNSPIEDFEFDELQALLGYENKDNIPTKHNPKYTIEHPVKMGSLSKIQIKYDKDSNTINWDKYYNELLKYTNKYTSNPFLIITPKYDGCSFEVVIRNHEIVSISGRGDGQFGADYSKQLMNIIKDASKDIVSINNDIILRGEVLIDKRTFVNKYSVIASSDNGYVNPRSWVTGLLGRDYDEKDSEYLSMLNDISIVIYDVKIKNNNNEWEDMDWTMFSEESTFGTIPQKYLPDVYQNLFKINSPNVLKNIYNSMNDYRINKCPFALDGIVIKPVYTSRKYNKNDYRPKDCVAIKFIPQLQETEVIDISWKLGEKSKNLVPTVITNPVEMDGKQICRVAASNYGKLIYDKISIGTKLILSLAGDIIPFIYKITDTSSFDENKLNIPKDYETYVEEGGLRSDGNPTLNLKAILTEDDHKKLNFISSAKVLNIPNLGGALTNVIFDYMTFINKNDATNSFFDIDVSNNEIPDNILYCSKLDIQSAIGGKNGTKIAKDFEKVVSTLALKDIIQSCNFNKCGEKVSEQCANYLTNSEYDFTHLAKEGYDWVYNKESDNYKRIIKIINHFGKTFDDYKVTLTKEQQQFINEQIPVILTGEPNDYASKGEFLRCHPEYRLTGKWTEVKIVFTNSLDSNTGKMKKAKEKGIEIRLY